MGDPQASVRRFLAAFALFATSLSVSVLGAEIVARLLYTKPWYDALIESQTAGDWRGNLWSNAFGLRDRDYVAPKPVNVKRILVLGDSFTYGSGVADNAATFPELLEQQLNTDFSRSGITIEVLNGGIPGSLTTAWVELLHKVKATFQPDLILIVFFLRDGTNLSMYTSFFDAIRQGIIDQNRRSFWYRNSYVYRLYRDTRDRQSLSSTYARQLHTAYFAADSASEEWRVAQGNIRRIKEVGTQISAAVALVVFPILAQLDADYPFTDICDLLVRFGTENDIPTHNLLPAFIGQNAATLWVAPNNQHPNPRGHQIAATSLLPFVRRLLSAK